MNLDAIASAAMGGLLSKQITREELRAALAQVRDEALEDAAKASWIEPISKAIRAMKGGKP